MFVPPTFSSILSLSGSPTPPAPTLLMDVPFSSDILDVSGNGRNFTYFGHPGASPAFIKNSFPRTGNCAVISSFGGAGALTKSFETVTLSGTEKTTSFWFYGGVNCTFFTGGSFSMNKSYTNLNVLNPVGGSSVHTSSGISGWHHYCIAESGSSANFYKNGALAESIGSWNGTGMTQLFAGITTGASDSYVARYRVWDKALTLSEVVAEYNRA